jgi:hypothetical protein
LERLKSPCPESSLRDKGTRHGFANRKS